MTEFIERLECPIPGHGSWQIRLNDSDVPRCGRYPDGEMCKRELVPVRYVLEARVEELREAIRAELTHGGIYDQIAQCTAIIGGYSEKGDPVRSAAERLDGARTAFYEHMTAALNAS